jgi:N-acetylneuraminate synthase
MPDYSNLIGEIGLSHEGSLGFALSLIDACKQSGLEYVKFQHHSSTHESTRDEKFRTNVFPQDESRFDYWSRTSFNRRDWAIIVEHCASVDIKFLCTPFSTWSANELLDIGCKEVKIASGDTNNWELLEFCKRHFKKVFLSTGMSTKSEIQKAVEFLADFSGDLIVLQCTSGYPTDLSKVGLSFFEFLRTQARYIGLSDHSGNEFVPMSAIARGADFVEFHVVFDKRQFGPDSRASLTFEEASRVSSFRNTWRIANETSFSKDLVTSELSQMRQIFGRGLSLKNGLKRGEVIEEANLTLKKPIGPLNWIDKQFVIGKRAARDIGSDCHITSGDLVE